MIICTMDRLVTSEAGLRVSMNTAEQISSIFLGLPRQILGNFHEIFMDIHSAPNIRRSYIS